MPEAITKQTILERSSTFTLDDDDKIYIVKNVQENGYRDKIITISTLESRLFGSADHSTDIAGDTIVHSVLNDDNKTRGRLTVESIAMYTLDKLASDNEANGSFGSLNITNNTFVVTSDGDISTKGMLKFIPTVEKSVYKRSTGPVIRYDNRTQSLISASYYAQESSPAFSLLRTEYLTVNDIFSLKRIRNNLASTYNIYTDNESSTSMLMDVKNVNNIKFLTKPRVIQQSVDVTETVNYGETVFKVTAMQKIINGASMPVNDLRVFDINVWDIINLKKFAQAIIADSVNNDFISIGINPIPKTDPESTAPYSSYNYDSTVFSLTRFYESGISKANVGKSVSQNFGVTVNHFYKLVNMSKINRYTHGIPISIPLEDGEVFEFRTEIDGLASEFNFRRGTPENDVGNKFPVSHFSYHSISFPQGTKVLIDETFTIPGTDSTKSVLYDVSISRVGDSVIGKILRLIKDKTTGAIDVRDEFMITTKSPNFYIDTDFDFDFKLY